ncbi:MAG: microcin C ABC transporter permease YejB [Pseudomonadales bacterium]|nr:microcin C ABC transporter permease YejB [Pseudomonadales bacterium]
MLNYLIRRLMLIVPTLFGIMLINFLIIQAAPGGPVEQTLARLQGQGGQGGRLTGGGSEVSAASTSRLQSDALYRGAQGLSPDLVAQIKKQYGFDQPASKRFELMVVHYLHFNFGQSFYKDQSVISLILQKMPVSISLGLWSTLIIYLVSIPLGVAKAVRNGARFDTWSSTLIIIGNAIPGFLFAIVLIVLFAGGSYLQWFPMQGLVSANFAHLSPWHKALDYLHHIILPVFCMVIGGFAGLTMLTKNSFLDEINKQYVMTARSKGLGEHQILYGHVFRNAMIIVIAGLPGTLLGVFFTSSLLIEVIFNLDGMGLLSFESAVNRDYPVIFGMLYIFTLLGLFLKILSDLTYTLVDPRIDFERRS